MALKNRSAALLWIRLRLDELLTLASRDCSFPCDVSGLLHGCGVSEIAAGITTTSCGRESNDLGVPLFTEPPGLDQASFLEHLL